MAVFQELKDYLEQASLLSKPRNGKKLLLYLAVSKVVVSGVLMRLEERNELLVNGILLISLGSILMAVSGTTVMPRSCVWCW